MEMMASYAWDAIGAEKVLVFISGFDIQVC